MIGGCFVIYVCYDWWIFYPPVLIGYFWLPQELKSFQVEINVDPKYHPKIIGRSGAVIKQLKIDHQDVNIQMPNRDAADPDKITITGYEASANSAKDAILKIVHDLVRFELSSLYLYTVLSVTQYLKW